MKITYEIGDAVFIDKGSKFEIQGVIIDITPQQQKATVKVGNRNYRVLVRKLTPNI